MIQMRKIDISARFRPSASKRALSGQSKSPGREVLGPNGPKWGHFRGFHRRSKVVKIAKIWGPGHGFVRLQTGPPTQRQLVRGLAAASLQDPQKGSKLVKIRSNLGSLRVPPRSFRAKGTNRHILARAKIWGSGGLKMGQNRVKMAFSLTPDRQNDKNWLFQ